MKKNFSKKRKGFTLIELIIVLVIIAILALVAFSGGKRTIAKSKMSVVQSDFHTIELAAKQMLLEHPEYVSLPPFETNDKGVTTEGWRQWKQQSDLLNRYLPDEMQIEVIFGYDVEHNKLCSCEANTKQDPWSQPYRVVFTPRDNYGTYRIYVFSSGPNGKRYNEQFILTKDQMIDEDDLIMSIELSGGDVKSKTWYNEGQLNGNPLKHLVMCR